MDAADRHLPHPAPIEAYGKGGFRFGGLSHRGSLMCLPHGIWASAVTAASEIDDASMSLVFAPGSAVDHFLIGAGAEPFMVPTQLRALFGRRHIALEAMSTGAAVRTYNILLAEGRRIGALLVAVE